MEGWRPHIESALSLGITQFRREGKLKEGTRAGTWAWWRDGEQIASIGYTITVEGSRGTLRLNYSTESARGGERQQLHYAIQLESQPLGFGGMRWWFRCPCTNRRVGKLYKFSGIDWFCARTAVRPLPTYASQRASKLDRVLERRWAIRRKLADDGSLFDDLVKPKGMRWRTFARYAERDEALAEVELGYLGKLLGLN